MMPQWKAAFSTTVTRSALPAEAISIGRSGEVPEVNPNAALIGTAAGGRPDALETDPCTPDPLGAGAGGVGSQEWCDESA